MLYLALWEISGRLPVTLSRNQIGCIVLKACNNAGLERSE